MAALLEQLLSIYTDSNTELVQAVELDVIDCTRKYCVHFDDRKKGFCLL